MEYSTQIEDNIAVVKRKMSTIEAAQSNEGTSQIFPERTVEGAGQVFPKPTERSTRKRKYVFKTASVAPKKCRKFYFINELGTKPRKPKIARASITVEDKPQIVLGKRHKLHFTRADNNGNLYLMHRLHLVSDLFFNDEKKCNYEAFKKLDLAFHIVDEIALEGLDGITLEAFWKRLKIVFPNHISKTVADRIWRVICNNKRMNFYVLKEAREELIFFDHCKYLDIDSGMFVEPFIEFKDIYPLVSVNGTDIKGSCATFGTRKENNGVRKFSMEKAIKLYDQKLVIVADQALRNKALINEEADPNIELMDVEYCMLEKIGRSREQGEFTQGKMSLVNDTKKVYHNRKALTQHFLIVHQNFSLKSFALQQNISGGLIHLTRFYHKRKTKHVAIMERIAQILRTRPNNQIEFSEFRKIFGRSIAMLKLVKTAEFRKFFKICAFPYRKLYPNATKQEYLHKSKHKERQVKVLRMIDPYANVTVLMDDKHAKDTQEKFIVEQPGHKLMNYEYLRDIFMYILSTGLVGVTIQEIYDHFKTDFYSVRMAVKKLLLRNVIGTSKIDLGRQQSLKFYAKCHTVPGCQIKLQPKKYELSDETLKRILKGYDALPNSSEFYIEPEHSTETPSFPTQFKLEFEPFYCSSFLTETVDAYSEELTIYDIVSKGRDKLLLIESNLFVHYMSDWEDFLLKREDFCKGIPLFRTGFGKEVHDFLTTVRLSENMNADNHVIFNVGNVTPETKIGRQFNAHRIINIPKNYNNPHSDSCYLDIISKIYVFEGLFDESRKPDKCIEKMRNIFERVMLYDGKRKRKSGESVKPEPKIEVEVSNNLVMDKFMGSDPVLEFSGREEEITTEIFSSTKPEETKESGTMFISDDVSLTQRYMNRANLILKTVYEKRIVQDVRTLYKDILKEEDEEGYDKKACKKSILSILSKLVTEGYVKCYKLVMTGKNTTRSETFVCVHDITDQHSVIRSTIEQLKMKFYVGSAQIQKTIRIKKKNESPFSSIDVKDSITELKQLTNFKAELNLKSDKMIGKSYGYAPKFEKMKVLHELLFYVIREMTESEPLMNRQFFELCKRLKIKLSQGDIMGMPSVYRNEVSWKMFIPPLPSHSSWPKGWALACDIVLRMPLSVFVKLYNISYEIPELETYLNHPVKRHYLVKYLPTNIRNVLFYKRKYFHSIYETISNLCYVGLLQLGPRSFKEKDQLFIYVNSRSTLYDTCSSKPGYNLIEDKKYKKMPIEFKSGEDVEIYWSELFRICMNTPLGKRKVLDGQFVTIEDCSSKPAMSETLKAKTFQQAVQDDNGKIPGDRRGSAGFDSSIWSFVKRNWMWNSQTENKISDVTGLKKEKFDATLPAPIKYDLIAKGGPPERKVYLKKRTKKVIKLNAIKKLSKKKKVVRKIVAPRKKRVREYCDAIDKLIMKKNPGVRVEWSEEEDQILRYCRAASVLLCPNFKKQFIPYNILRDVLHRVHPKSKNKTARAVQRRIYVLLTNDETLKIMETNIENLLNSDTISKYFEQIHHRYKNGIKINDTNICIAFIYLMSYICKHKKEIELLLLGCFASFDFFSKSNVADFEALLQNCENSNNTIVYTNPGSVEDITKDTIKAIVHCSMACRKNSVGWTFHLSRIYKKFPDDLIRTIVHSLKKDQFFVQNKSAEMKNLDNIWPVPIKFSHVYNTMKQSSYTLDMFKLAYRNFAALIQGTTEVINFMDCNEVSSFWEDTNIIFDVPEMGIILKPEIEDHSEVIEELAKRLRLYLEQIYQKNKNALPTSDKDSSGYIEKNMDEIKDEIRHLIFRVPYLLDGDLETYFRKMLDSANNLEINNYIFLMIVDLKKFAQSCATSDELKSFIDLLDDNCIVDKQQTLVRNLSKIVFAIQNIHQQGVHGQTPLEDAFKLWEIEIWNEVRPKTEEINGGPKTMFKNYASGMEHCIKRAQEGSFPSLEEIKEGIIAEVEDPENRKIPHVTDLIMLLNEDKFPDLDTDVETVERMKEHFVMQYPKLNKFVIEDLEAIKQDEVTKTIIEDTKMQKIKKKTENITKQPHLDHVFKYICDNGGNDQDVKTTEDLIDFIKQKRELGAPANELKTNFTKSISLNLLDLLEFLTDINVVLRTGIASIVYVHHEYQTEWLTETFILSSKEKELIESKQEMKKNLKSLMGEKLQSSEPRKVQLKPWTKLDGTLNDEIFLEWLCVVLSRCVDFPNIPFLVLCEHFHYIKPVDIYFLLEILQELGCVTIYVLNCIENGLFAKREIVNECKASCLDPFQEMFVKPTNVSGLCFGSFLDKDLEYVSI